MRGLETTIQHALQNAHCVPRATGRSVAWLSSCRTIPSSFFCQFRICPAVSRGGSASRSVTQSSNACCPGFQHHSSPILRLPSAALHTSSCTCDLCVLGCKPSVDLGYQGLGCADSRQDLVCRRWTPRGPAWPRIPHSSLRWRRSTKPIVSRPSPWYIWTLPMRLLTWSH